MTLAERCADPAFQKLLARAYPRWWTQTEQRGLDSAQIAQAILTELCDGRLRETHPEYRALVSALERVKIADGHGLDR